MHSRRLIVSVLLLKASGSCAEKPTLATTVACLDPGAHARLDEMTTALSATQATLEATVSDLKDTRMALNATRKVLGTAMELLEVMATQLNDLSAGRKKTGNGEHAGVAVAGRERALSSPADSYHNSSAITRISAESVHSCHIIATCDLTVEGEIYYQGQPLHSPGSPTPAPTLEFSGDCSDLGVYARFEIGGKCPLVHYDMSTLDGSRVKDLIGGNNLDVHGSPLAGQPGVIGTTYQILSASDYFLSMSSYPAVLRGGTSKSISLWALPDHGSGDGDATAVFASFGASCTGGAFAVGCQPDGVKFFTWCNDIGGPSCADKYGSWHHYVVAYDGSEGLIYVDGELSFSSAFSNPVNTNTVFDKISVGVDTGWSAASHFLASGRVDEVKIYSYALSADEVRSLFSVKTRTDCSSIGVYADFETGFQCPLVHYDMSTLDGSRVKDLIGGNNLDIIGTPTAGQPGVIGTTFQIRSASDYFLSISGFPVALRGGTSKSISLWALLDHGNGDGDATTVFASFGASCTGGAFAVGCQPDGVKFFTWCNDIGGPSCTDYGVWHHYVITYGGLLGSIFIDGELGFSSAFPNPVNTNTVFDKISVGVDTGWSAASHFLASGRVDEVKIYSYALSADEVRSLYELRG